MQRLRSAARVALWHLGVSALVAVVVAALVFLVWYPPPFDQLIKGRELFLLLLGVDLVCGPLLTLVLFDPLKARYKWRIDMALIVCVQSLALVYGITQVAGSRAVFLAFEGDRFRVVQAEDVVRERLDQAPAEVGAPGWGRPRLIGTRLLSANDPTFASSIQLAMQGLHPAFRPERWVAYDSVRPDVQKALKPLTALKARHPLGSGELQHFQQTSGLDDVALGYLPLVRGETTDWVAIVRRDTAQPVAYFQLDGW
jgi:hypothetical protein